MTLPDLNLASINKRLDDTLEALAKSDAELKWELAGSAADIAGLVDPTPTSDLIGAGLALRSGDFIGAALSTVSMVPYVGDAMAKPVKAVRTGKKIVALEQKVAKLTKEANDLKKLKKEAEAAEVASAKEGKAAAEADNAKETATRQREQAEAPGKDCEDCKSVKIKPAKLKAGTPEHKMDRWERYQKRGGEKGYEQWSKQYDVNMRNYRHGAARETLYRQRMGATEGTVKTPFTNRQIDILKQSEMYAGQLKTGPVSLTRENILAIKKDSALVDAGWNVEHILEKGASAPYLEALEKAGIEYSTTPKF